MTPEGKVKEEIKRGLAERGIWYFMPVQTGYGKRSVDFICCWDGGFVAIEAKAGKNKPSAYQRGILNEIEEAGGRAIVAYSWRDVADELEQYG